MDVLGMRAIAKSLGAVDQEPPEDDMLFGITLIGDLISNALYFSQVGTGRRPWVRGLLLGLLAGLGAVFLPGPLGLGKAPSNRTPATQTMTVGWYVAGGLAAAATAQLLGPED